MVIFLTASEPLAHPELVCSLGYQAIWMVYNDENQSPLQLVLHNTMTGLSLFKTASHYLLQIVISHIKVNGIFNQKTFLLIL